MIGVGMRRARRCCSRRAEGIPTPAPHLEPTPSDMEGPYRPLAGTEWGGADLRMPGQTPAGTPLRVAGRVLDTRGQPLAGARLYVWQANASGRYNHPQEDEGHGRPDPAFRGHGSLLADEQGFFALRTIVPAGYRRPLWGVLPWRFVPHIHLELHALGKLLTTQINVEPQRQAQALLQSRGDQSALPASAAMAAWKDDSAELMRFDIVIRRA
jgi:protocatechuate 3,4-dioxygenase, beta subunit